MDVQLHFPSDAAIAAEEAARFRALSSADRMRVIRDILNAGELLIRQSLKADFLRASAAEEEELSQRAVRAFIARHVR